MVKSHQKKFSHFWQKTTTPCQHRWHHPQRAGAPRRQARERNEDLHRACSCVDNEAREGVPGSRGKKRRPARRHAQHAYPRPSVRRGVATGRDAPRRGYGGLPVSEEGRKSERETARPLARQLRRAVKLLRWGSRRPTPRGEQAEGAVRGKMKSTGVPDAWGSRGSRRRGGARERHEAVQHQVPDMGLALPKRRPAKKTSWIEVREFPIWGSNP